MEGAGETGAVLAAMAALEGSWLGRVARSSTWLYPLASVLHVLGLAFLLGSVALFDLRLLGAARRLPADAAAAFLLPLARAAFAVQLATGMVMFAADASHIYGNRFFLLKMALVALALANVALFHRRLSLEPFLREEGSAPSWAKAAAAASLTLWIAVAVCGRMIAYD